MFDMNNPYFYEKLTELKMKEIQCEVEQARLLKDNEFQNKPAGAFSEYFA